MQLAVPIVAPISDDTWELQRRYEVKHDGFAMQIRGGFPFDGCSIPRVLWRVFGHPLQGLALPAALVHDALYATQALPRHVADRLFYELLLANGVNRAKAWAMYQGVRLGGWAAWAEAGRHSVRIEEARAYVAMEYMDDGTTYALGRWA